MWWMSQPCIVNHSQEFLDELYGTNKAKDRTLAKVLVDRVLPVDPVGRLFPNLSILPYDTDIWRRQRVSIRTVPPSLHCLCR